MFNFRTLLATVLVVPGAVASSIRVVPAHEVAQGKLAPAPASLQCTIHIAGLVGENETSQPCGSPVARPGRPSMVWIEDRESISFPWTWDPVDPRNEILLPLVRAATVDIHAPSDARELVVIRIPDAKGGSLRRRVASRSGSVAMPEGRIVAYAVDHRGRVLAISPPIEAGKDTVSLKAPDRGSDVVAFVEWPDSRSPSDVRFLLNDGHEAMPSVQFIDAAGAFAVWYSRTAERGLVSGGGEDLALAPVEVLLRSGAVATVQARFRRRPELNVEIAIPDEANPAFFAAEPSLRVMTAATNHLVAEIALKEISTTVKRLPAEIVTVELHLDKVRYSQTVNLIDRDEARVSFPVSPITIDGSVRKAQRPVRANVGFRTGLGGLRSVETDEAGEYSIVLWNPDRYALEVTPLGEPVSNAYTEMVLLSASRRLDIDIPNGALAVRIVDSATRKPVPNARTFGMIAWNDSKHGGLRRRSFSTRTDATGIAVVDLLRTGHVEVRAAAEGYHDSDPVRVDVLDGGARQTVEIALQRANATARLRLLLPNGAPAARAEILAAADAAATRVAWHGTANADGEVDLPRLDEGTFLFIRHPHSGGAVRRWRAGMDVCTLPPRAPSRLVVHVATRRGSFMNAFVALAIDGHWISGTALEFLARSSPIVEPTGIWSAEGLPAAPTRVLAWRSRPAAEILGSAYDTLASAVPFPWPPSVSVETVD